MTVRILQNANENDLIRNLGNEGRYYAACDPSLGKRTGKGDYTAIVILFRATKDKRLYVLGADIARRTPSETVERMLYYGRYYDFSKFAVESNYFQSLMVDDLKRQARVRNIHMPVRLINHRANKQSRIASLEPEIAQGRILFRRRDVVLLEQLRAFPVGAHDDGPDALEMAVSLARSNSYFSVSCMLTGQTLYESR